MSKQKSAKDLAFDRERAKLRMYKMIKVDTQEEVYVCPNCRRIWERQVKDNGGTSDDSR